MANSYRIDIPQIGPLVILYKTRYGPVSKLQGIVDDPTWKSIESFGPEFSTLPGIEALLMVYAGRIGAAIVRVPPVDKFALLHQTPPEETRMLNIQLVQGDVSLK